MKNYKIFGKEPVAVLTTVLTVLAVIAQIVQGVIQNLSGGQTLVQAIITVLVGGSVIATVRPLVTPTAKVVTTKDDTLPVVAPEPPAGS